MSQLNLLISTLKQQLKAKGKTYSDIASYLKVSESSIKRIFMNKSFTINRLEQICHFIGLELTDLIQLVDTRVTRITQLERHQEQRIVENEKRILITIAVLNGWNFNDIIHYYDITHTECYQCLVELDSLNIIELLPFNKFKVLVSQNFSWIPNGPIENYFRHHMRDDFFKSNFSQPNELFLCLNGMLSYSNNQLMQKKLQQVKEIFAELHQNSVSAGIDQADGSVLVIGLRPYRPDQFERHKRK